MADRGPDGKFIAKTTEIKMEENSSSRTTPTSFTTGSPDPGSSDRVQQAKAAVGAAARLANASAAPTAIDNGTLQSLSQLEADLIRREELAAAELARQEAALLLQRQAEADAQSNSSTGGAAAIAGADELARRTADLQT